MKESDLTLPEHSIHYDAYFEEINEEIHRIYALAEQARLTGVDPTTRVEIPPAHDVAGRVEATLEGPKGVAKRIRELQQGMSREEVAFKIAEEIASGQLGNITDPEKAADKAVRVALAVLTESITAAPLEGIARVRIRGSGPERYLAIYLAGPIRAAGGTEAAMTVLVADYVRQVLDLPAFVATEEEVERALEEVELYARAVHLQYPVEPELVKLAASKLPIMLTGDPTEEFEVSGSRDIDRIETNRVRGGAVLVLNDGVVGRATKLSKIVEKAKISGWEWLDDLAKRTSKSELSEEDEAAKKLDPKSEYLADVIGGRPVFSHPSRSGGFRLRYGRSRNTGLAGVGVHPATMHVVEGFLAPGTHIRTERPGKGSIVTPVDTIEGPIVLLNDGSVKQLFTAEDAKEVLGKVERIIYLGDVLVALGEFLENNHPLVPSGYCEEWWSHDLDYRCSLLSEDKLGRRLNRAGVSTEDLNAFINLPLTNIPTPEQAVGLSKSLKVPLHPRYLYRWNAITVNEAIKLRDWILKNHRIRDIKGEKVLLLPANAKFVPLLQRIGVTYSLSKSRKQVLLTDSPTTMLTQIGDKKLDNSKSKTDTLAVINSVSKVELMDKLGFSIGARMGRPEKAEERKMRPPVQVLFPVGRTKGSERRIDTVAKSIDSTTSLEGFDIDLVEQQLQLVSNGTTLEMVSRQCPGCGYSTFESRCPQCDAHTEVLRWCAQEDCGLPIDEDSGMCPRSHDVNQIRATREVFVNLQEILARVKSEVDEPQTYNPRGVLGLTSDMKIPEYLGKGILRAKHGVYCYRDGTARFDITDAPLTHFIPEEVGVSIKRLRELGYHSDYLGEPLTSPTQVIELKVQDIIIPDNCADYLVRVGRFVDDCLEKIYHLERYYRFDTIDDILGQLIVGLAPHTSAGIVGRIVGFTNASICYAHPYWHAAKRRNCDGDEDALILVLDALLNFSKEYLPAGRGGFMDAPLVLSVILNPSEVDDEAHNIEVCHRYPAQFFEMVADAKHPKAVEGLVDIIASRLGTEAQYEGFGFTHGTSAFDAGPQNSRYKTLGSMEEKLNAQLDLAILIDAVDSKDVAERVLSHHFIRDIRGNLRAYSTQKIQCRKCHRVYRRVPLSGACVCGSDLSLTVRKRNISKYLRVAEKLIAEHGLGDYLQERLKLVHSALDSLFYTEQTQLTDFI
ncbi:MAG: DNA polymerase II large subunit [Candidatus Thorarchaeota archaeon]|nr:MAG: DNA polymerase II large subunit [Candidatus Thorarchaeota archaeon]